MRIVILGAGGHAKVVIDSLVAVGKDDIVGLTDPDPKKHGKLLYGYPIVGGDEQLPALKQQGVEGVIVALGTNRLRKHLFDMVKEFGFTLVNAIHPQSWCSPSARIGEGVAIMAGAVVNADAYIGNNTIINTGATVDHEVSIGDHTHVGPGCHLCGNVKIGAEVLIGAGAIVIPEMTIGDRTVIGAGAVVVQNIQSDVLALGIPARVVPSRT